MTRRTKFSLSLTGLAVVVLCLWMRSLASWRPVKLAIIDNSIRDVWLLDDGHTMLLGDDTVLDLGTGTQRKWPELKQHQARFSPNPPLRVAILSSIASEKNRGELCIKDVSSGKLMRVFHWPTDENHTPQIFWSDDGLLVGVVDNSTFSLWETKSGQQLRQVALQSPIVTPQDSPLFYAISTDRKKLIGCGARNRKIWSSESGKLLRSWPRADLTTYAFLAANQQALVRHSNTGTTVLDVATGKIFRSTMDNVSEDLVNADEIFSPQDINCEVADLFTGQVVRYLPGPRINDGQILHVTHDWIYTVNAKGEIFRWRAR